MRRREFIAGLGSAAVWPVVARAQRDARSRRVGALIARPEGDLEGQVRLRLFQERLGELGWVNGRNLQLDVRWAETDARRLQSQVRELVALTPDAFFASSTNTAKALQDATHTTPIVFAAISDPVETGLVSNLARPDGNATGFMSYESSMAGKWLSLLKDMAPRLTSVALLFNPATLRYAETSYLREAQKAGERLALKVTAAAAQDANAIGLSVAAVAGSGDGGLVALPDFFNVTNKATTIAAASRHHVPAIYHDRNYVEEGGLMSWGPNQRLPYRDGATYIDHILRGAKPIDMPVQFATKFELLINLKTAKSLGLTVPETLLATADEVIQ